MKLSKEIINLPIISIVDGQTIGKVKSLIINDEKGSIDFLMIDNQDWEISVKMIPFKKVIGIGEYAVTVESEHSILDLMEIPVANQLISKKVKIIGTKVMTRKGELIGEVYEFLVNEENGHLTALLMNAGEHQVVLPVDDVITYSKDLIIVKEDAKDHFEKYVEGQTITEDHKENDQDAEEVMMKQNEGEPEVESEGESSDEKAIIEDQLQQITEKQVSLLVGKRVTKDVYAENGDLLVAENVILSQEDIEKVLQEGPHSFIELSMSVEVK